MVRRLAPTTPRASCGAGCSSFRSGIHNKPSSTTSEEPLMQTFINGAKYAFSASLAEAVAISLISNAATTQASAVVLPADGDIVVLNSNWTDLNELAPYAANPGSGKFDLS